MRRLTALVLLAVIAAPPSFAAAQPQPDSASAQDAAQKAKLKCKRIDETPSGSNMKKWTKVCKPASEWNPDRIAFERSLEKLRDQGLVSPGGLQSPGGTRD